MTFEGGNPETSAAELDERIFATFRFFLVGSRLYQVAALQAGEPVPPDAMKKLFESFRLRQPVAASSRQARSGSESQARPARKWMSDRWSRRIGRSALFPATRPLPPGQRCRELTSNGVDGQSHCHACQRAPDCVASATDAQASVRDTSSDRPWTVTKAVSACTVLPPMVPEARRV